MKAPETITTQYFYPKGNPRLRLFALWYFVILLVIWTILGHTVLGFEQSWTQPLVAVLTASLMQFILEWVDARANRRTPRYQEGDWLDRASFFVPAWIPALAVAMLLYPNDLIWPMAFAAGLSIASKVMFRAPVGKGTQHVFNPSNFGITLTLLAFPWIGLAPPYHFTENVVGVWNWVLPGFILLTGIIIHALFTGRLPLVSAWLFGFLAQAFLRCWYFGIPWLVPLVPMTSAAFIVFTLYMIPDPATTPLDSRRQVWFGLAVAAVYGLLQVSHVVFGLFIALFLVCGLRGTGLYWQAYRARVTALEPVRKGSVAAG